MAQNEIVKILRVETQGSERTVKGLKDEISALKDALLNTQQGTQQYDDIVKQLRTDQEDLTRVMNASKQDVEALEGSYNHLVKTMAELKKEWRATTSEARRNQLGQEIDNINTQLKDMDASIGNYQRNVGNYAGGFSDAMREMQASTEVTRARFESVSKIATGLASGYAALQGATALMGVENEKLQETFVKLQAAIALAQGIGGIKDLIEGLGMAKVAFKGAVMGVKSFITSLRGVKAAIAGTGIGLLVVAVGMLVEYLMNLGDEAKEASVEISFFTDGVERLNEALKERHIKDAQEAITKYAEAVRNANGDVKKLVEAQKQYNEEVRKQKKENLENDISNWQSQINQYKSTIRRYTASPNTAPVKGQLLKDSIKNMQEAIAEYEELIANAQNELNKIQLEETNEIVNNAVEANEKMLAHKSEVAETMEEIKHSLMEDQELELHLLEEKYNEQKELLKNRNEDLLLAEKAYLKEREAIIDKYDKKTKEKQLEELEEGFNTSMGNIDSNQGYSEQETEVKYDGMEAKNPVEAVQLEIDKLNELRDLRLQFHNERLQQIDELLSSELISDKRRIELESEKANLIRENAIEEQKYINETAKLEKKKEEEKKKVRQLQYSATLNVAKNTFESVAKLAKEGSTTQKALSVAATTIDTYQSATAAYKAMAGIPVVGPALGIAAAAAAVASGLANVKQILSVDAENGETSSPTGSGVSVTPSFNAEQAMPIEYTRNILTSAETDELNKPQRVYVLESDITETQNKVEVTENNATF